MPLLLLLVGLVVLAVVGVVAAGRVSRTLAPLADAPPDLPPLSLPAGPLTAADLEALRLPVAVRGYRMDQVDAVLDRLAAELAARDARLAELEAQRAAAGAGRPKGER